MQTRRAFVKLSLSGGAGLYVTSTLGSGWQLFAEIPGGTLPPRVIPKFVTPLVIPPAMPPADSEGGVDYYRIAVRQFRQQILPAPWPRTTVWSYGAVDYPTTFNYPAFTIEATADRATRVTWINQLMDARGRYLPHLLAVDQTLHWANPPGGPTGRDSRGHDSEPYLGPVPIVTHLHGGHSGDESDGFAEAWFLPPANNIPAGYATEGTWYHRFKEKFAAKWGGAWTPGSATFHYANDQRAGTLWYHDHALGMTRLNVYAGPAGFYLIRGGADDLPAGVLPGPAPSIGDAPGMRYYEIPVAIQDRSFDANGALFYPGNRAFFEGLHKGQLQIPFIPEFGCDGISDVSPIWNPEFFGNTIVVNGATWPYLEVERRRYRFRFLNGCNSRFLILKLDAPGLPFWQIGAEGGFLDAPVRREQLLIAPAERADVVVDFTHVPVGTQIIMRNLGPDEPFGEGLPDVDFAPSDRESTGLVMKFRVVAATSVDTSTPPESLVLPARVPLPAAVGTRDLSLNELESETVRVISRGGDRVIQLGCNDADALPFGPTAALLGTVNADGTGKPVEWREAITENPAVGATEVWAIHNFTEDAHPIHIHMVMFEVVEREDIESGAIRGPEPWEAGPKDTVIAFPQEITRVKATFDLAGRYVWHCHIVEHEDNEMMRPYVVGPIQGP
jgi:FtsP/CotA-like multicopper oxidase with cupredoxin domain